MSAEKGTTPFTNEEIARKFVSHFINMAHYWATVETDTDRVRGMAFSILAMLDGTVADLPAFNISPAPHPEDMEYCKGEGERWYEPDIVFNAEISLHDLFVEMEKEANKEWKDPSQ